ncbi:hypothetical protein J8F10_17975 [Gemmata sp. G18]|uniref:Glycosyl hydrolase family 32 N-terminal domain-containing protein n=1 Tax=Gemmata palustris TaxID=2822762 RepID=A0ABS5BTV9_9BACT|nr:hypothetical protein [Gemmata palustris]MBP3957156.1 hypothetical protein [Gemmata palustris]
MPTALIAFLALAAPPTPIDIGDRKQLFIDDRFIAERDRVELRVNPPQKLGALRDEKDQLLKGHISRVIDDGGKVRLYLGAKDVQVLESDDGLKFRRTGTKLPGGWFPTVFLDPHETDPAKKYKLFHLEFSEPFDPAKHGVYASYSADGVTFTKVGRVFPFFTDNPAIVHWDERIKKYVIYTRAFDYDSENQRRIGRIETDDPLKPWPYQKTAKHRTFPSIENIPVVYSADKEDDPHSDVYYNAAGAYPWADDVYLMFPSHFRHFSPQRNPFIRPRVKGQWEDYGMLEVQMGVSRDGVKWARPERSAYIPNGLADEWDRWYTVAAPGFVRRGSSIYQYYYSSGRLHDSAILRPEYDKVAKQEGGVGVVKQRLDGFVSADADHRGGWLTTPSVVFRGNRLRLNIDTGSAGTAFVELQEADGKPIPGFALADCEEIGGNFIDQCVYWKGKTDVSALAGKPVRIHIKMKRTKLFAFQFTKD